MTHHAYNSLAAFGFSDQHIAMLRYRLSVPQFVYISGPAGGGKTKVGLMLALAFFQAYQRPFRTDGQDMTTAQIMQAAKEHNTGIVFNDLASPHDYMRAGYCVDCRMVALGIAFDGPSRGEAAYAQLLTYLPSLAIRQDVIVVGVERGEIEGGAEQYRIDLYTPQL
jgi:energy-coupling factor transporter ATP-binding protein EcfA2